MVLTARSLVSRFCGHGYIREWGQEQLVRDVRIAQIYEGTNGIQALDLMGRKVVANNGKSASCLPMKWPRLQTHRENPALSEFIARCLRAIERLSDVTEQVLNRQV